MCGIVGIFHNDGGSPQLDMSKIERLRHRGPDGEGMYHDRYVALGHTRLSIIDLSDTGRQPMSYFDNRYVITYNGEIYNYRELKTELKTMGCVFRSSSDTEVILAAYAHWGADCVRRFRGMFAFAIWDALKKTLFLARDRCGEKPLIYYRNKKHLIFASEFKGLLPLLSERPEIDPASVDLYLHYQYTPEPYTLLKDVKKLPAAHILTLSPDRWFDEPVRYWNVEETQDVPGLEINETGILRHIRDELEEAVMLTLRSDVPVGVALSGGIDSGVIAALAQKHYPDPMHAFAVGYPGCPSYDEREQARGLAEKLGMIFHEVELPINDFVDFFPRLVHILDEPIADIAAFGHHAVPGAAADCGIKVLLTGIGGDELFWGYPWTSEAVAVNMACWGAGTRPLTLWDWLRHRLYNQPVNQIIKSKIDSRLPNNQLYFFPKEVDFWQTFDSKKMIYGDAMANIPADNPFRPTDIVHRRKDGIPGSIIRLLFETWLVSNCLNLGDRVSMAVGVETRLPFLDVKLIEVVMALRRRVPDYLLGQKAWLRLALKGVLPGEVLVRPKRGFQPPVIEWISGVIGRYGAILRNGKLESAGIVDRNSIYHFIHKNSSINGSSNFLIYKLLILEMWLEKIVSGEYHFSL